MISEVEEAEELRKKVGESQEEFAHQIGVSLVSYHNWVQDHARPSYDNLQKLKEFIKRKK